VHQAFPNTPIVGMGGVANGRDALELVLAGASAVSVGTASFGNPMAALQIRNELSELLTQKGFSDFRDAIGFAHRGV
jgi:dihydroorotate dehydrogenase (NAD+) catalytic subunit